MNYRRENRIKYYIGAVLKEGLAVRLWVNDGSWINFRVRFDCSMIDVVRD